MIGQSDQASNQYGFYAVPKALEPKRKYREEYEDHNEYSEEEFDEDNQFETIQRDPQNEKELDRDYYVDEAPYPQFKPKERGLDYGVQIERHELFDFDLEVQPLIEILVGRSVVSAINQLQEEKQVKDREAARDKYDKKRNAELMVTQRLQTKNKRKKEEADRRKLQKEVFVKNKKLAGKKVISRTNAKHCLLNLKEEVLEELQQDGFLRQSTYLGLRVQYQGWLYEQIKAMLDEEEKIKGAAHKMIKEKEGQVKGDHQKFIDKQNKRRKDILDERQRVRKANQQRKMKKRIRKQRLQLNAERSENNEKASEAINKYEQVDRILKNPSIGNGFTRHRNTADTVHISGGLLSFITAFFASSDANLQDSEIQTIFHKILKELQSKLEVPLSEEHYAEFEKAKKRLEEDAIDFMRNKEENIKQLVSRVALDLSLLENASISIKSALHNAILSTLLNIVLNTLPQPKMEGEEIIDSYEPSDKDKSRESLKEKISLISQASPAIQQKKNTANVVRVRFEKIVPEEQSSKKEISEHQKSEEPEKKQVDLDEWIEIYDGEGWSKRFKGTEKERERGEQAATSYALPGFEDSLILDERNLHYLHQELEKLIDQKAGQKFTNYKEGMMRVEGNNPVYDIEMEWE